jgi:hypothetical protein
VGETPNQPFQLSFNPTLKVEFQGSRVTFGGGLILVRELDDRLGFSDLIAQHLTDPRSTNTQLPLADLVREPAATVDEEGWPAREARPLLLAPAGGGASATTAVRGDRAAACDAAGARGVADRNRRGQRGR